MKDKLVREVVRNALKEDIGPGDLTTKLAIPSGMEAVALIKAKEPCVVCGIDVAEAVFLSVDRKVRFRKLVKDGEKVRTGQTLAEIKGEARTLLAGERTALNFLQRMSGISTMTAGMVSIAKRHGVKVLDTRKTTPGLRVLEKYAVRCGGGKNHRFGLYDGIMIKDNHTKLVGVKKAVEAAKRSGKKVEVEVGDLKEVREALEAGADVIMLDNFLPYRAREAVKLIGNRAAVEASGRIDEKNIEVFAETGVDSVSAGKLTHSVRSADIGMYIS